jgi:hypothetical protein
VHQLDTSREPSSLAESHGWLLGSKNKTHAMTAMARRWH